MHRPSALMMWPDSAAPSLGSNQVKGLIEAAEAKLARTKSEIQHLVRICDHEREIIATLKPLIAPIRKLSAEFLVKIFQILVDSAEPKDREIVDRIDAEGPTSTNGWLTQVLVISQVCRKWRGLACTTPQLWNRRLEMTLRSRWDERVPTIAKTFLERSAPLPIPIMLDYESSEPSPLTDYIYSQAPRWKSLFFRYSQISGLRELPMDALKSLENLYLKTDTYSDPSSPVEVFLRAPRLRTVILDVLNVKCFPMPWSQLTNLTICDCEESAQILFDILRRCTNLVSLDLSGIESRSQPGPSPVHMIRLVRLETLIVQFCGAVKFGVELCIAPFFTRLNLPELTVLKIFSCTWVPLGPSADIEGFLRRSRKIEQLSISGPTFSSVFCICVLMESPNLVELSLHSHFSQGAFDSALRLLRYDSDKNTAHPVPRLRSLRLINDNSTGEKVSKSLLEKTIVSRWWTDKELRALPVPPAVARWECIWISNHSGYLEEEEDDDDFSEKIAELREQGLEVDIE